MPESDQEKFDKDPRLLCKYGIKCYQKNPKHHQKYKHPPKQNSGVGHSNKKLKAETPSNEVKEVVTRCDASDSDDYNIEYSSSDSESKPKRTSHAKEQQDNENKNAKVPIRNDVSDTEESDSESTKNDSGKPAEESSSSKSETEDDNGKTKEQITERKLESKTEESEKEKQAKDEDKRSDTSKIKENKIAQTISDPKTFIKDKFLVNMPEDFYRFWEFCKKFKPNNPTEALKDIGLFLVGPFDVLSGKFNNVQKSDEEYLIHWRYFHDPPEFQTVLKGDDKTGYHIGYFRDSPDELPVLLASNHAKRDGLLSQMGGNIFSAVNFYLEDLKKTGDPFKKMHVGKYQAAIKKEAERLKVDLSYKTDKIIARERNIVTRTFNKIGLVVPYDKKTQLGYRELAVSNKDLTTLFTKLKNALPEQKAKFLSDLQPVFTYASIATDECDFGTGIELGWNIIAHGVDSLDSTALRSLTTNYRLLQKEAFAKIAESHLKGRKRGCNLSIV